MTARKVSKASAAIRSKILLTRYNVHFTIEVARPASEPRPDDLLVEKAVTSVIDEEIGLLGTRCGLKFTDAMGFDVRFVDEEEDGAP